MSVPVPNQGCRWALQASATHIVHMPATLLTGELETPSLTALGERLARAAGRLPAVSVADAMNHLARFPIRDERPWRDPLADHVCASNVRDPLLIARKAIEEASWARQLEPLVLGFGAGQVALPDLLADAGKLVFGAPRAFRREAASIVADSRGRRVVFPSAAATRAILAGLDATGRRLLKRAPALAAVLFAAELIHCHPFPDGNGRLSRALFGAVLRAGAGAVAEVPVLALENLAYSSFLIRMRRAYCHGDWEPIVRHWLSALDHLDQAVRGLRQTKCTG